MKAGYCSVVIQPMPVDGLNELEGSMQVPAGGFVYAGEERLLESGEHCMTL